MYIAEDFEKEEDKNKAKTTGKRENSPNTGLEMKKKKREKRDQFNLIRSAFAR